MIKLNKAIISFLTLQSTLLFAGTMGPIPTIESFKPTAYVQFGSGGSYSLNTNIYADPKYWDSSPEGYNAKLKRTALYSAAFGYHHTPLWSTDLEYSYRPDFKYSKYQTSVDVNQEDF